MFSSWLDFAKKKSFIAKNEFFTIFYLKSNKLQRQSNYGKVYQCFIGSRNAKEVIDS
jgi:hypothetical protein